MTEYLTTLACIAGAIGIAALIGVVAVRNAPLGYQDEHGFHVGSAKLRDLRNLHSESDTVA